MDSGHLAGPRGRHGNENPREKGPVEAPQSMTGRPRGRPPAFFKGGNPTVKVDQVFYQGKWRSVVRGPWGDPSLHIDGRPLPLKDVGEPITKRRTVSMKKSPGRWGPL
jgi:hypothetical protein